MQSVLQLDYKVSWMEESQREEEEDRGREGVGRERSIGLFYEYCYIIM